MFRFAFRSQASPDDRRGAAHILIAVMLFAVLATAAMTVDFAYMQLVRTELRTATDAAAKAGAEALARTQDGAKAKEAAVAYAQRNNVAGKGYNISTSDVKLGRVTGQNNGSWTFTENATPYNAVRVDGKVTNGSTFGAVKTFFGPALGQPDFQTSQRATAGQQEVEVVLCLDRSGSMCFDMSGVDYSYPPNNPFLSAFTAWGVTWRYYLSPPHPTESRWAKLSTAVNVFLDEAGAFNYPPRTALVTWGSVYTLPITPFTFFADSTIDYPLPSDVSHNWSVNKSAIQAAIADRTSKPMCGGTNLSAGLDMSRTILQGATSKPLSNKIIILLTDGQWNAGRNPLAAAQDAANAGMTIHAVSMLTSSQAVLSQVAATTGGQYYVTQNETELRDAFRELARSLPIVLTD